MGFTTPSTLVLTLKQPPEERLFSFLPGQYAAFSFYRHGRPTPARCFSIVNSPNEHRLIRFSMRSRGRFTKAASQLKAGDPVDVRGPFGGFVLDLAGNDEIVMLAGGIGITPFMSMLSYADDEKLKNRIKLFFSNQTQDDIPFRKEIRELERSNSNFEALHVIGKGPVDKLSHTKAVEGMLDESLLTKELSDDYGGKTYYICGPPPFMNAMLKLLRAKDVADEKILTEAFAQGPNRQTGKILSWPKNVYALSAAGLAIGSFVVMISDLLKTLPPSTYLNSNSISAKALLTDSSRQTDLDALVNDLPASSAKSHESPALKNAIAKAKEANAKTAAANTSTNSSPQQAPSQTTTSPPASPTPAPAVPTKQCTTSQSGVTTCV